MDLTTYAGLKDAVTLTAMRTGDAEFEAAVPAFIRLAEVRMSAQLRTRYNEKSTTLSFVDGVAPLPTDYAHYRTLVFGGSGGHALEAADSAWILSGHSGDQAGTPQFFAIQGNEILLAPKWSGDLVLVYFSKLPPLSEANPENWALNEYPNIYLYGSLIEAAPFMLDDQRVGTWGSLYESAVANANGQDQLARYANVASRVRGATP